MLQEQPDGAFDLDDLPADTPLRNLDRIIDAEGAPSLQQENDQNKGNGDDFSGNDDYEDDDERPLLFWGDKAAMAAVTARQEAFLLDSIRKCRPTPDRPSKKAE